VSLAVTINLDDVAAQIRRAASESISEEDLRIRVESILKSLVLDPLGIPWGRYEYSPRKYGTLISGVRIDALHANVVVEYERPYSFEQKRNYEHALQQVKEGILRHAQGVTDRLPRYFGVALDGFKIGFVRYRQRLKDFEVSKEPLDVNRSTVARVIEAIIGLKRKALDAEELLKDFGPDSEISRKVIKVFYEKLTGRVSDRTAILFSDWKRVFSQVCAYEPEKLKGLEERYGFERGRVNVEKLLFSLHSYFALLMKLLAAEVASLYWPIMGSYLKALEDAYYRGYDRLKDELRELEEGGLFAKLGISNFLEGDYFAWYLDEWDATLADSIALVVKKLSDYDPGTADLEPDRIKDLFKRLYQNLVPKKIRHDLGEYYTPDWLAELVLNEVGYTVENLNNVREEKNDPLAPLELRVLDPACGSGTFLVLVIKRLREYIDEHWIDKGSALHRITKNVVGFDLNPLAVMASRANYLISIGDMLRDKGAEQVEIPIYLADSIMVEQKPTVLGTSVYLLRTVAGNFEIPVGIVERGVLSKVLSVMEECVKTNYTSNEFIGRLEREVEVKEDEVETLKSTYGKILKLEKEGKNRIWLRILKNSFAPLLIGEFDYVVGNPPWINWEHLPESYRNETRQLLDNYGLLKRTRGMGLGKVKRDMAMLFVTRCLDRFTKDGGKLSFLVPYTVFKTQAGAGFRKFLSRGYWLNENENSACKVLRIHDLVTLYPFEGAVNRTSLLLIEKSEKTNFPIPCVMWHNPKAGGIDQEAELEEVKKITKQFNMVFLPIEKDRPESPWMQMTEKAYEGIKKIIGSSPWYKAYVGVHPALNQVYWIQLLSETPTGALISNPPLPGQKKEVKQIKMVVEKDLIYPLIRGRNIKKWYVEKELRNILLPVDERNEIFPHAELKLRYPHTYEYFFSFFESLVKREAEPYKSKLKPYREMPFNKAEKYAPPFYWLFNVKPSLAPYKVAWKEIAGKISGKAEFSVALIKPEMNKIIIPDHKVIFVPLDKEEEAFYLSAILNSEIVYTLIASYAVETAMDIHITQNVLIPKFDSENKLHSQLSYLSKKAHNLAKRYYEENDLVAKEELNKIEEEINRAVAQLYGITDDELGEIKKALKLLKGEEIEEEEGEPLPTLQPDITLRNNVTEENKPINIEAVVLNPLDQPISDVKIKVEVLGMVFERLFDVVKGEIIIPLKLEGLKKGQYKVKLTMDYMLGSVNKRCVKELSIYVKESEVKRAIDRGKVEELFEV